MRSFNVISNQFGDRYFYEVNRDLFERESASARLDREFRERFMREDTLHICIGSDSGTLIQFLSELELPLGSRFVFVETEDLYQPVKELVSKHLESESIWLVTESGLKDALAELPLDDYFYVDGVRVLRSLSAEYSHVEEYRSLYWDIDTIIKDRGWNTITRVGMEPFLRLQLENCADSPSSVSALKDCLKGATAIVLAGGPSLDDHLNWVKTNRDKLVVIAVSRISRRLLEVGLEPDFVISVDPQDLSYQLSREMLSFSEKVIFIYQYHVATRLLSQWPHRKFHSGSLLPWDSDLNPDPDRRFDGSGPTVTNYALAAAGWLGARRVLLAGVDLCFTNKGITHAKGSREYDAGPRLDLIGLTVETNAGLLASTLPDYLSAGNSLNSLAGWLAGRGVSVETLSLNAYRMENIAYIKCSDVKLPPLLPFEIPEQSSDMLSWLSELISELQSKKTELQELRSQFKSITELHDSMYQEEDAVDPGVKVELEQLEYEVSEEHKDLLRVVKTLAIRPLMRMAHDLTDTSKLSSEQIKYRLSIYYKALESGIESLLAALQSSLDKANRRLVEAQNVKLDECLSDEVIDGWIAEKEFGRFKLYPKVFYTSDQLESLREHYEHEMMFDYSSILAKGAITASKKALPTRVNQFLDRKDLDGLVGFYQSLSGREEYGEYLPLILAAIEILKENWKGAIEELIPVVDNWESPILEPALAHIFMLAIELSYQQEALDALAGLSLLNKSYLNLYSDALAANGQVSDAVEHQLEYCQYFGIDGVSKAKLSEWLNELGREEELQLLEKLTSKE